VKVAVRGGVTDETGVAKGIEVDVGRNVAVGTGGRLNGSQRGAGGSSGSDSNAP